jgi:putative restriction endonuclease
MIRKSEIEEIFFMFGKIDKIEPGDTFSGYVEMMKKGVHGDKQKGIFGWEKKGAESIVISGGYIDDEDQWTEVIYTGEGGRDKNTGRQVRDQKLTLRNKALVVNQREGIPVRVIRGAGKKRKRSHPNPYAPAKGYRYDGLYQVADHWSEIGRDGFLIYRFRLVLLEENAMLVPSKVDFTYDPLPGHGGIGRHLPLDEEAPSLVEDDAGRQAIEYDVRKKIKRDRNLALRVKALNEHECQFCGKRLLTVRGHYSEAAHIRPLGSPHEGPDVLSNMLCLCSDHHVLFDTGTVVVNASKKVFDRMGRAEMGDLRIVFGHSPDDEFFAYHREYYEASIKAT